ncbi:MAG: AAA family ATPase [Cyanobacteria bacterium P01_G01_bin.54]
MLTRLKVSGFKNLVDVDVRFGPFTCIAGANGVGKSNLFDAIKFLSNLATMPLTEAALSIRGKNSKFSDIRNLFHRVGDNYASEMSFEAEMIIPRFDLNKSPGAETKNTVTVYRYKLCLAYQDRNDPILTDPFRIISERLCFVGKDDPDFQFPINCDLEWNKRTILFLDKTTDIFSYHANEDNEIIFKSLAGESEIKIDPEEYPNFEPHRSFLLMRPEFYLESYPQDFWSKETVKDSNPKPAQEEESEFFRFSPISKIVSDQGSLNLISSIFPNDWVRKEMQSWQNFHFEPSALRKPSKFRDPAQLSSNGSNLPKTLYTIAQNSEEPLNAYGQISRKLSSLIDGVRGVEIKLDNVEEWLTFMLRYKGGTSLPAHALSDGTLRLLALAVLGLDPYATGVYCIEEPENGFHPDHIPKVIEQLLDIAVDPQFPVEEYNPLRQVIINTHSPAVVRLVPDDSLVIASVTSVKQKGEIFKTVELKGLKDTWRYPKNAENGNGLRSVYLGQVFPYLNPTPIAQVKEDFKLPGDEEDDYIEPRRTMDREDLRAYIPGDQKIDNAGNEDV